MKNVRLFVWGLCEMGVAVVQAATNQKGSELVGVYSPLPEHTGKDVGVLSGCNPLGIYVSADPKSAQKCQADCVIVTTAMNSSADELRNLIVGLLTEGLNVIATIPDSHVQLDLKAIQISCEKGRSSFHATGLMPHLLLERFAMTLAKALQSVDHIRMIQAIDCTAAPLAMWGGLSRLGFNKQHDGEEPQTLQDSIMHAVAANVAQQLYCGRSENLRIERELQSTHLKDGLVVHDIELQAGSIASLHYIYRVFLDDHCFLTCEENWHLGGEYADYLSDMPYSKFTTPYRFAFDVTGEPSKLEGQLEFEACSPETNPLVHVIAQGAIAAVEAVCDAAPGIVLNDATPRYRLDERLPASTVVGETPTRKSQSPYRVAIWGPGEIGGAVTRAALKRKDIKLVGAKVFSPSKAGKDLGELVGIPPIGVQATLSKAEIKALKPDCVIVTPQPRAIVEGLDKDVLDLLSSGINVITSAAYHNVTMPNWLVSSQRPSELLMEVANTSGMARNFTEEIVFGINRMVMNASQKGVLNRVVPGILNTLLKSHIERVMPLRATSQHIIDACISGGAALHGAGVHPTFMAERVGIQLANLVGEARCMRFVEAADFSYMPDGMWGGLEALGFGKPVENLDSNYLIAKAGDFYYGDVVGNAAHSLYGVHNEQVRVERSFRALPAAKDFKVGSRTIRKGCSAALHMVHKGYLGDHHFFTNEECWYLGPECEYRGDDLPFGNFKTPLSYTIEVEGKANSLKFQLGMAGAGKSERFLNSNAPSADARCALGQQMRKEGVTNPITNATAMVILDAVSSVCKMPAGVIIDDVRPSFRVGLGKGTKL